MRDDSRAEGPEVPELLPEDPGTSFDSVNGARPDLASSPSVESSPTAGDETSGPTMWLQQGADPAVPGSEGHLVPYHFRRMIGRGGMGEVWEAVQVSLNRMVAVKKLRLEKGGAPATTKAEFFRHEAFATAALDHPNIVPVYDFGRDQNGRPMMAMKLIRGEPWSSVIRMDFPRMEPEEFLAKHLAILADVAQAVAFAHDAGIVHRDLKPGQVMLGSYGEVLLMDWGLAVRAGEPKGSAGTTVEPDRTAPAPAVASSPAGTPAYMAPEQTLRDGSLVGTWTDVYLLGGILYNLLTGTRPHEAKDAAAAFRHAHYGLFDEPQERAPGRPIPADLVELARHAMQPVPADRLASAQAFLAALHEHQSGRARRRESRELTEQVLAKMSQLPTDYSALTALVNQLARARLLWPENIEAEQARERLLAHQSRVALEEGDLRLASLTAERLGNEADRAEILAAIERARLAMRRREKERLVLRTATAALLVLVVGGGAYLLAEVTAQRNRAEAARKSGDDLLGFMIGDLREKLDGLGRLDALADVGARAEAYFASLPPDVRQVEPELKRLRARRMLAVIEISRGRPKESLAIVDAIRARVEALPPEARSLTEYRRLMAELEDTQASAASSLSGSKEMEKYLLRSAAYSEEIIKSLPGDVEATLHVANVRRRLAGIAGDGGRPEEALALIEEARRMVEPVLATHPGHENATQNMVVSHTEGAAVLARLGRYKEAVASMDRGAEIGEAWLKAHGRNAQIEREVGIALVQSANILSINLRDREESVSRSLRAVPVLEALAANDPTNLSRRRDLLFALSALGTHHEGGGDKEKAAKYFEEVLTGLEYIASVEMDSASAKRDVAIVAGRLGELQRKTRRFDDAERTFIRSIKLCEQLVAAQPGSMQDRLNLAVMTGRLGLVHVDREQDEAGEAELRKALGMLAAMRAEAPEDTSILGFLHDFEEVLAAMLGRLLRHEEALASWERCEGYLMAQKQAGDVPVQWWRERITVATSRADILITLNRLDEALEQARLAHRISVEVVGMRPKIALYKSDAVRCLRRFCHLGARRGADADVAAAVAETIELFGGEGTLRKAEDPEQLRVDRGTLLMLKGTGALRAGDAEAARAAFADTLELLKGDTDSASPLVHELIAWALLRLDRADEAKPHLDRVKELKKGKIATEVKDILAERGIPF